MRFYSLSRHKGVAALFVAKYLRIFALGGGQMATLLVSVTDPYPLPAPQVSHFAGAFNFYALIKMQNANHRRQT